MPQNLLFCLFLLVTANYVFAQSENLGKAINSEYNELAPVISPDGNTLYFSRISHPNNGNGTKGSQDIWYSEFRNGNWLTARRLQSPLNRETYNSLYSISPDGNTILIKGAYAKGRYETRGFSISKREARGWSAPEKLEIPGYEKLSKGQFDCGYLSADGKVLILSFSEKKDSKVDDLYVSFKQKNGSWSKPESLGPEINTKEFTETTPFLAADGVTLYFSSDRPGGMGSNDIYYSKRIGKGWKRWSKPANLGPQINTDGYDAYYSISALGDFAYFTSFKNAEGKGGDIVRLKLRPDPPKPGETPVEIDSSIIALTPDPVVMVSGKVIDSKTGKPVSGEIIYIDLADGEEVGTATTNPATGEYKIVLPYGKKYSMYAKADNFLAEGENLDLTGADTSLAGGNNVFKEITGKSLKMVPIEEGQMVRLNNIFFETGKSSLNSESSPELDRLVMTMNFNQNMEVEIGGHTDDVGSDASNLKLSQDRADSVREYLIGKGIEPDRIIGKGYGESKPIATNSTPEGQQANRRVEFKILKK